MADVDIVIEICGSAGEGTISAGEILSRAMSRMGFEIMSFDAYPSEIRGFGKCVAHCRVGSSEIFSSGKYTDILIALNDAHAISQLKTVRETGIVIFDNKPPNYLEEDTSIAGWIEPGMISYGLPLQELAQKAAGNSRGRNMVALGALAALFHVDPVEFSATIQKRYAKKKQIVIDSNLKSFDAGYRFAKAEITKVDPITFSGATLVKDEKEKSIINGNEAVAMAALDSDLALFAGYPITPATKIMEILAKELPARGGVMLQTEDELAAIGNVIGAGFAGKRAMTATSGPGFCLMTELCGLAVMAEVPAVVVNSQRGGPSTGLPTKTEQSDLDVAVLGGSGDSPRIVLAPTTVSECHECTWRAFYLAEKYQTLVIILLDFFLSNSIRNIETPEKPAARYLDANIAPTAEELFDYRRFSLTENGISPRAIPGTVGGTFIATGLESNERGKPVYDTATHTTMTEKRFRKLSGVQEEVSPPTWYGEKEKIDIGVIAWGSTAGAALEAVMKAKREGINASFLSSTLIFPIPEEPLKRFSRASKKLLVPELNHTGQYANLIAPYIERPVERLNMVTGLPMAADDILEKIRAMANA